MKRSNRQLRALAALNLDLFHREIAKVPAPATIYTKIGEHARSVTEAVAWLEDRDGKRPAALLPTQDELYRLFERYNWMFFDGKLSRPRIEFSSRMTSAGAYVPSEQLIKIGRKYHEIFPEELTDTLKHEMIHINHIKHDAAFKAEARRLGTSVTAKSHPALQRPPRYVYFCKDCGIEYPRQRRLRMASCGTCSKGGEFDSRYKLQLKRSGGERGGRSGRSEEEKRARNGSFRPE